MQLLNNSFFFGIDFNFSVDSPFMVGESFTIGSFPPVVGHFLLLDETSFLLLDGGFLNLL